MQSNYNLILEVLVEIPIVNHLCEICARNTLFNTDVAQYTKRF